MQDHRVKGKKWLLLSRWKNLAKNQRGVLSRVFQLNQRNLMQSLPAKRKSERQDYRTEGHDQLPEEAGWIAGSGSACPRFRNSPRCYSNTSMGILNYRPNKVHFGVVEAINGNIRMLINPAAAGAMRLPLAIEGCSRMAVTNTEYVLFRTSRKPRRMPLLEGPDESKNTYHAYLYV